MTKRRDFSDKFKATVALEAPRGDKMVQEIAAKRQLHPTQVSTWKRQAIDGMAGVFSDKVAIVDWAARKVPTWWLSNAVDTSFCV
jgi:transposase